MSRAHTRLWVRGTLGVFVLAFLAVALQPCAVAMQPAPEPDCPHCPPRETLTAPCQSEASPDCMTESPFQAELRGTKVEPQDHHTAMLPALIPLVWAWPGSAAVHATVPIDIHPPGEPRLNVRYCVYLN